MIDVRPTSSLHISKKARSIAAQNKNPHHWVHFANSAGAHSFSSLPNHRQCQGGQINFYRNYITIQQETISKNKINTETNPIQSMACKPSSQSNWINNYFSKRMPSLVDGRRNHILLISFSLTIAIDTDKKECEKN